jgi:hypothetical protein
MFRRLLGASVLLLVLFHAWLFVQQLWAGHLADVALLARWAVAAGLAWALVALGRQGAPLFFGRKAVAIWLLAALLHGPAAARRVDTADLPGLPDVVATMVQVALGAAAVAGLVLLAGLLVARFRPGASRFSARPRSRHALAGALGANAHLVFAPRPPPPAT